MSYEPKTWKYGDEFTPDSMNHIEQGIKANADAIETVNSNLAYKDITNEALSNPYPDNITHNSDETKVYLVASHIIHIHITATAKTAVAVSGMGMSSRWGQVASKYRPKTPIYGSARWTDDSGKASFGVVGVNDKGYICLPAGTSTKATSINGDVTYTI